MEPEIEVRSDTDNSSDVSLHDILKAVKAQGEVNSKLRQELSDLKHEFHGSSLAVASQVKKLKVETEYKWKFEGNKIQHSLNSEILEDLNQIIWALHHSKTDYATDTVNEIIDKLKKRNKLIKIADTSECGWETVRQYETNPVASDTDDENKIIKAENRAIRKRKFKSTKKTGNKSSNANDSVQNLSNFPVKSQPQPFRDPQSNWYSGYPLFTGMFSTGGSNRKYQQGACYGCGSMQHWRNKCPFNPKADNKPKAA